MALGDSTTAGTPGFLSPIEFPPDGKGNPQSQYAYWIQKKHPEWKVLNRGFRAERSDQILGRFERDVPAVKPDVLVVLAGVNDLYQGYSAESIVKNLQRIYEKAVENHISVIACTILPYHSAAAEIRSRMKEVNDWIRRYAEEHRLGFCDTSDALEDPNSPGQLQSSADGLHPDVAGYQKMGEVIAQAIEKTMFSS